MGARLSVLALCLLVPVAWGETIVESPAAGASTVTYISGASVYIGVGVDVGLEVGQELRVLREGVEVGVLTVEKVASTRASCSVVEGHSPPEVGDVVQLSFEEPSPAPVESFDSAVPLETAATPAAPGQAAPASVTVGGKRYTTISHIDKGTVFVASGQDAGLLGGDQLDVIREGRAVARLEVTDLGADLSGCYLVDGKTRVQAGDLVRMPARITSVDPRRQRAGLELGALAAPTKPRRRQLVHGRVGVRHLMVRDHTETGGDLSQPALDLRIDGRNLAGRHMDIAVDVRSRRTYRPVVDENNEITDQTRVYRMAMSFHDRQSRFRFTLGRQFSPSIATVSTFDGGLFEYNGDRWSTGVFAGTQPAIEDFGYSDDIREYGTFVQVHNRWNSPRPWSLTFGLIGSYFLGEVNREFAYLQALYSGPRLTFYATGELDYARGWKIAEGEDEFSLTSSYAHLSYRIGGGFTMRAGYDNRRNIRLYRDYITPEVEFDDTLRRGAWVGFTQRIKKWGRIGIDAKNSKTELAGDAQTYTLLMGVHGLTRTNFALGYRGTAYFNDTLDGRLHSLNTSVSATRNIRVILNGGLRQDTFAAVPFPDGQVDPSTAPPIDPAAETQLVWYGVELDFNIGKHWFLMVSGERTQSDTEEYDQSFLAVTYRF